MQNLLCYFFHPELKQELSCMTVGQHGLISVYTANIAFNKIEENKCHDINEALRFIASHEPLNPPA